MGDAERVELVQEMRPPLTMRRRKDDHAPHNDLDGFLQRCKESQTVMLVQTSREMMRGRIVGVGPEAILVDNLSQETLVFRRNLVSIASPPPKKIT
jgi:hypothetical protein